jgi:hypothetical protein
LNRIPADIQAVLDTFEPQLRKAFLDAVEQVKSVAQMQAIIGHLQTGNVEAAVQALRLDKSFYAPLDRVMAEVFWQGGVMALASLPRMRDPFPGAE